MMALEMPRYTILSFLTNSHLRRLNSTPDDLSVTWFSAVKVVVQC